MQRLVEQSQKYKQISDLSDKPRKHDVSRVIDDFKKSKAFYVDNNLPPLIKKLPKTKSKKKPAYWRRITDITIAKMILLSKKMCVCVCFFSLFSFIDFFLV